VNVDNEDVLVGHRRLGMRFDAAVPALIAVLLAALLAVMYADVLVRLQQQWYDEPDYSHGYLVPIIVAYLVWERRERLRSLNAQPDSRGLIFLIVGLLALIIGSLGAELFLQRFSLVMVLAGLVLFLLGPAFLRALLFPIACLFFMIPLPTIVVNTVAFPLQLFAAKTAAFCLVNFGIPAMREGNLIVLAGTTLEVAEACSGIRSLQALLALGTLYAYFSQTILWKRVALIVLSIPIAIVANAFRVAGTGMLAHYWGTEAAEGFYHTMSGWLIFVVAFLLLLGCGFILSRVQPAKRHGLQP
jgi:exosortase